jgi:LysR family transcriptional regulator, nitrogen assimilation regulatory protein
MDLRQLQTFLLIADAGSLSRAAEQLHKVQPALSRHVRMLEEDLGAQLFVRHARGMLLTDAGERLLERARIVMRELDEARADVAALAGRVSGTVGLGMLPSIADVLAAPFALNMRRKYEHVRLRIATGLPAHLIHWLEAQQIDVAIIQQPLRPANLKFVPMIEEPLLLVGPRSAPFRRSGQISLRSLGRYPLIVSSEDDEMRLIVEREASKAEVTLDIAMEANFMHNVQKGLIKAGLGYAIIPASAVQSMRAVRELAVARVVDPPLVRRIGIGVPIMRKRPVVAQSVAELVVEQLMEALASGKWRGARMLSGNRRDGFLGEKIASMLATSRFRKLSTE